MKIEIFIGGVDGKEWFWHFRSSNGKITANGEAFISKNHAARAAKTLVSQIFKAGGTNSLADFVIKEKPDKQLTVISWTI